MTLGERTGMQCNTLTRNLAASRHATRNESLFPTRKSTRGPDKGVQFILAARPHAPPPQST